MAELFFLRHGTRIDHARADDPAAEPLVDDYKPYDPSLAASAVAQIETVADDILRHTKAFETADGANKRKNVFVHFLPYLRTCQTADLVVTALKKRFSDTHPDYKVRFLLLGDFALSEWVHDKMKEKPPFIDSNDAYQMYTPNIKLLANKGLCLNFRPTNTLGQYNGLDLSYKDYQNRCKNYFKKLLATYEKPIHLRSRDIVIVVSHGYCINNFLLYFINHPIFEEIPEASINFAERVRNDDPSNDDPFDPANYTWTLRKDALDMVKKDNMECKLNLETDIVYYKTNFIKKDEVSDPKTAAPAPVSATKPVSATGAFVLSHDKPRPSFKIKQTSDSFKNDQTSIKSYINPICPAAKDWSPQLANQFRVKSDFALRVINDTAFKKNYILNRPPPHPISPDVSPSSKPTRNNLVIDLSVLTDDNDQYKPMKLRYSTANDIPIHRLNLKVNSQVSLALLQRNSGYGLSNDSLSVDLPKYLGNLPGSNTTRKRSLLNPVNVKDSYFPATALSKVRSQPDKEKSSELLLEAMDDDSELVSDLDIIEEHRDINPAVGPLRRPVPLTLQPPNPLLSRSKSLNHKRTGAAADSGKSLLGMYQQQLQQRQKSTKKEGSPSDSESETDDSSTTDRLFSLSFQTARNGSQKRTSSGRLKSPTGLPVPAPRVRRNSFKLYPSSEKSAPVPPRNGMLTSAVLPGGVHPALGGEGAPKAAKKLIFFDSDESDSESEALASLSDEKKPPKAPNQYIWFGQNRAS